MDQPTVPCRVCSAPKTVGTNCTPCQKRRSREHYLRTRAEYIQKVAAWQAANKERTRAAKNRSRAAVYADPVRRERLLEQRRRSEAKRRAAIASTTVGAHVTGEDLASRIAYYGGMCWICRAAPWEHVDHVKPIAKGGPHMLANLRPACADCNKRKSDTWPFDPEVLRAS